MVHIASKSYSILPIPSIEIPSQPVIKCHVVFWNLTEDYIQDKLTNSCKSWMQIFNQNANMQWSKFVIMDLHLTIEVNLGEKTLLWHQPKLYTESALWSDSNYFKCIEIQAQSVVLIESFLDNISQTP